MGSAYRLEIDGKAYTHESGVVARIECEETRDKHSLTTLTAELIDPDWSLFGKIKDPCFTNVPVLLSLAKAGDTRTQLQNVFDGKVTTLAVGYPERRTLTITAHDKSIDARRKKAEFLAAAGTLVGPHVRGLHLRGAEAARAAPDLHHRCQLVVNRAMGQADEVLAEVAPLLRLHGHLLIWKGPAFEGQERDRAAAAAPKLGFRVLGVRRLHLEDGDPERIIACYERI